jgi:hypothetical protein
MWEQKDRENIFRINGLLHLVRSEGGRICCNFSNLPRRVKKLGAFRAYRCFSSGMPNLHQVRAQRRSRGSQKRGAFATT